MAKKSTELRPVMVRLPETLRRRVERDAERNGRSMNTEIIHRLEQSFTQADLAKTLGETVESLRLDQASTGKLLAEMQGQLSQAIKELRDRKELPASLVRQEVKRGLESREEKVEKPNERK